MQGALCVSITKPVLFIKKYNTSVRTCPKYHNVNPTLSRRLHGQIKQFSKVLEFKFHYKPIIGSNATHGLGMLMHILQPRVVSSEFVSTSTSALPLRETATTSGTQQSLLFPGFQFKGTLFSWRWVSSRVNKLVSSRAAHHREMDNNAISCSEELKIA